jgi:hypothetical protein
MKTEVGSFSANSSSVTVLLNDGTLNVKGIYFLFPNGSGFTDGITNRSMQGSNKSTTYCIDCYNGATLQDAAYATSLSTAGEFTLHFDNYLATVPIYFMVVGD